MGHFLRLKSVDFCCRHFNFRRSLVVFGSWRCFFVGLVAGFVVLGLSVKVLVPKQLICVCHQYECSVLVGERKWKKELSDLLHSEAVKPSHNNREAMAPPIGDLPTRIISHQPHHMLGRHTQRSARPGGRSEEESCASTARATIPCGSAPGSLTKQ